MGYKVADGLELRYNRYLIFIYYNMQNALYWDLRLLIVVTYQHSKSNHLECLKHNPASGQNRFNVQVYKDTPKGQNSLLV
jgi:hypothetical protein